MKLFPVLVPFVVATMAASPLFAQHSDVEFGYDSTVTPSAFVIEQDNVTVRGFSVL